MLAGFRVAAVSTVALTTVGTVVSWGGLGDLLSNGVQTDFRAQVLAAAVLCVLVAVALDLVLVGVGGITTVEDARERLEAGADLLQGYTAFVYEGPGWPRRLVRGLSE